MKIIATTLNLLLLGIVVWLFGKKGLPPLEERLVVAFFLVLFACPIVNIIALAYLSKTGWLGLYFQRKALEEKKKIKALNNGVREDEQNNK